MNQPFQTLSPCPWAPTLFMPSFQSPVPISGMPWGPSFSPYSSARTQCSYNASVWSLTVGQIKVLLLVRFQDRRKQEGYLLIKDSCVACDADVMARHQRQEVEIVA